MTVIVCYKGTQRNSSDSDVLLLHFEKLNETNNTLPKQLCGSTMISISFLPDVAFDDLYFNFSTFLTYIQESNQFSIYMLKFYLDVKHNLIPDLNLH